MQMTLTMTNIICPLAIILEVVKNMILLLLNMVKKDYLKNTDLAYVVCDKIVDADSISFVYHGEYETWHFKLLNTEAN